MKKVLIVDDAQFMRLAIRNILEKNQFEVAGEAANGIEAIQKYKELKPDIVTMDLTMPEMTGIEALKAIMEYDRGAKVVVVSALGQEVQIKEAVINGARSFIVKPIKEEHLVNTLNKILDINKSI
ncbi:two-component system chemotaxis response regulator CheY [Mobilisporobacter senegalensis]|uniref:Stage 0 sporulation protein A homolog n=1 Tax=Mobilisporobacter senegalensis TaxID=1329262 RepID=A0A3N1XQH0_9FIRM|nr:response regulator [Mobilisporobacter senegalensis]ROR27332.1 two-component system chemotaxis response regulator CheY [Mobilisporobacter senegalensis]